MKSRRSSSGSTAPVKAAGIPTSPSSATRSSTSPSPKSRVFRRGLPLRAPVPDDVDGRRQRPVPPGGQVDVRRQAEGDDLTISWTRTPKTTGTGSDIGGCSNGGFMTMRMVIDFPDFFAAAYPVCEALYDETISDVDIGKIAHMPIWFTHAACDTIVPPEETAVPTYKRLKAAGAENVHFSYYDRVPPPDRDVQEGGRYPLRGFRPRELDLYPERRLPPRFRRQRSDGGRQTGDDFPVAGFAA